jgi:hypothetical protein
MTIETIKKYLDAQPFAPFEIFLADGRKFPVEHPDFVALGGTGRALALCQPREDGFDILDVRLVASLHVKTGGLSDGGS